MTSNEAVNKLMKRYADEVYEGGKVSNNYLLEIVDKDILVLNIIRHKKVDVARLALCIKKAKGEGEALFFYNNNCDGENQLQLVEEEFSKLKEWLEND